MDPGELSATTTVINQAGLQGPKLGEVTATSKSKGGIYVFNLLFNKEVAFQLIRSFDSFLCWWFFIQHFALLFSFSFFV